MALMPFVALPFEDVQAVFFWGSDFGQDFQHRKMIKEIPGILTNWKSEEDDGFYILAFAGDQEGMKWNLVCERARKKVRQNRAGSSPGEAKTQYYKAKQASV